jgi:AraC family transcriptional regulator of adaptative response/methylated-DNA-[protein]-cysteine methyltransferase
MTSELPMPASSTIDAYPRNKDYQRVAQAIEFVQRNWNHQPGLAEVAASVGMSETHMQRLFKRWAGVTPTQYVAFLTKEHLKSCLDQNASVFAASLDAGLSGAGRAHDLMLRWESMTPGEYKKKGNGQILTVGLLDTVFGLAVAAFSKKGLCYLAFSPQEDTSRCFEEIAECWPAAALHRDDAYIDLNLAPHLQRLADACPVQPAATKKDSTIVRTETGAGVLTVQLQGSPFQLKVWEALLRIPQGHVVSYADVAKAIGAPKASRAVGSAIGANKVAWLIPCHRVLQKSGDAGNYRWGPMRKQVMLAHELCRV